MTWTLDCNITINGETFEFIIAQFCHGYLPLIDIIGMYANLWRMDENAFHTFKKNVKSMNQFIELIKNNSDLDQNKFLKFDNKILFDMMRQLEVMGGEFLREDTKMIAEEVIALLDNPTFSECKVRPNNTGPIINFIQYSDFTGFC